MTELCDLTAAELGQRLRGGETSSAEIANSCLSRIDAVDDLELDPEAGPAPPE